MNPIIPVHIRQIGYLQQQTVNARELWQFVESNQQFADWIKNRIEKYGFVENRDFIVHKVMNNPHGGRPFEDYYLTMDTAKELAMVEANAKGHEVRTYFIECERQAKAAHEARLLNAERTMMQIQQSAVPERVLNSMVNRRAFEMAHQVVPSIKRYLRERVESEQEYARDRGEIGMYSKRFIADVLDDSYSEEMIRDLMANL